MQVTIRANCWDGPRSQSWSDEVMVQPVVVKERFSDKLKRGAKRLNDPKLRAILGYAIPIALLLHGLPPVGASRIIGDAVTVMAVGGSVKAQILHAFDPLINLIQSLAYPIAGVMIAGGCLFIMVGNRDRGMQMLQNAAIGYILVQLAPLLLSILVGIGGGVGGKI